MDFLPGWMFVFLFGFLMIGYPVAFTIGALAMLFGFLGFGFIFFELLPLRIWGVITNQTLIAVPLFVFMGVILERSGLAEELLETMALAFGRLRGGLAMSVIIVGALLAASTGVVGATVVTMGLISLPSMMRRGYSPVLATGVIAASGTLGQIIPPSIVLVVLGDIIKVSVGDLFTGAILPGFVLVALYLSYVLLNGWLNPKSSPAIPQAELDAIDPAQFRRRMLRSMVPPLALIMSVLGSIFAGVATPTEAAGLGALAAMILVILNGKYTYAMMLSASRTTVRLTSMVFIILVGAQLFGLVFRGLHGDDMIREFIAHLGFGKWEVLAIVMAVIFFAGFFLDFIEICFIHVPVLIPIIAHFGFDPIWFAVLLGVNLQTSFLTPPFGYALFYLKSVCPPGVTTAHIYKGIVPFVALQLMGLIVCVFFPELILWLPRVVFGAH
jgi:tripartite ATP-independent transporter DctM subunit